MKPTTTSRARLSLEALEARETPTANIVGNNLVINPTFSSNIVTVKQTALNKVQVNDNGVVKNFTLPSKFLGQPLGRVVFNGGSGGDLFTMNSNGFSVANSIKVTASGQGG